MTNLEHHSESYWQSVVLELRLSNRAQTESLMEYEKRLCDIARLANRVLLIGEEEGWFEWKGDAENGGNHSSLHRDLTKVANSRVYRDFCDMHIKIIKSLEEQIQGLQSLLDFKQQEISVLESKVRKEL